MKARKTPIALFTYDRPQHTQLVLSTLAACERLDECQLYIYCDAAKSERQADGVTASRRVVHEWAPKLNATVVERFENFGLAKSIVTGVTDLCNEYGRAIVIEDDFALSPDFLDFMLQGLDRYADVQEVYQISGYMFPVANPPTPHTFFLRLSTTWGWATWQRAWNTFEWQPSSGRELLSKAEVRKSFDLDESYPYSSMLEQRVAGLNDSWGILWWWNVFRRGALVLYPRQSLVWVGGFDGSGTHCAETTDVNGDSVTSFKHRRLPPLFDLPEEVAPNDVVLTKIKRFLNKQQNSPKSSIKLRVRHRLKKLFAATGPAKGVDKDVDHWARSD